MSDGSNIATTCYAVTVVGHDRPGIVADVTGALAEHGGNIEDSSMSLLRGHFAWTLIVALAADQSELEETVAPLRTADLMISVLELPAEDIGGPGEAVGYWLTVHGSDHPGIVSAVTRVIADAGGNLTNLSTRLVGELYVVGADVDLPPNVDVAGLGKRLTDLGKSIGVNVALRSADSDVI